MNKEKWLLNEIAAWERKALIGPETAEALKALYAPKKNANLLIAVFSVIGSLLIGAGIILILAKNWYFLPLLLRVALAFLPLILSQALAVYVVKDRYDSVAWREASAILVTASVFAAIAIVGQAFHISGDYASYVLTCGLLSLPLIYLLDASAPLLVYYWTILNWAALEQSAVNAVILAGLFAAGAAFVFINRRREGARLFYMTWLTLIAAFAGVLILGSMLGSGLLLLSLCYFTLLLSVDGLPVSLRVPFNALGLTGGLITVAALTYESAWEYAGYAGNGVGAAGFLPAGVMLVSSLLLAAATLKRDRLKALFLFSLVLICVARGIWAVCGLDYHPFAFIFAVLSNIVLFSVGVGFMVRGVRRTSLLTTNIGMAAVCVLIVLRFFDSGMDFLWRGVVFLVLGTAFLLVNLGILRKRRGRTAEVEE